MKHLRMFIATGLFACMLSGCSLWPLYTACSTKRILQANEWIDCGRAYNERYDPSVLTKGYAPPK